MTIETLGSDWDVVVVGAGIAGSAAALRLARDGVSVLLVDKSTWPRDKVCGGCINAAALRELEDCGVTQITTAGQPYATMHLACGGRKASFPLPPGRAVTRRRLDELVVAQARRAGACFLSGTKATLAAATGTDRAVILRRDASEATVKAKIVLDCSGLGEQLTFDSAPPASKISSTAYIGVGAVITSAAAFYRAGAIHMACAAHGYVGLVCAENDRVALAAALDPAWTKHLGGPANAVTTILNEAGFPAWPELPTTRWRGTPLLTRRRRHLGDERVFVLGDAAGYVEPFTGEGIGWALADAAAIEPLVLEALRGWHDQSVAQWGMIHHKLLRRRQRVCQGITRILRRPRLLAACLPLINSAPATVAPLTGWLNHRFKTTSVRTQ